MKIVVISDTHLHGLDEKSVGLFKGVCQNADLVIHLGDWDRWPVLDYMEQYPLEGVTGNMDDEVIRSRLPVKKVVRVGNFRVGLVHGWGESKDLMGRLRKEFDDVDAIFFGHTHQAMVQREGGLLWVNPGSLFHGRGARVRTYAVVELGRVLDAEIVALEE